MKFSKQLEKLGASPAVVKSTEGKTFEEAWAQCEDPTQLAWLIG